MTITANTAAVKPMTDKQLSFINALIAERDAENFTVMVVKDMLKSGILNIKSASTCIDTLLKTPKAAKKIAFPIPAAAAPAPVPADVELTHGIYDTMNDKDPFFFMSGRYVLVYTDKNGFLRAKVLWKSYSTKSGLSWKKSPTYKIKQLLNAGKAIKLGQSEISALGKHFNACMYCGLTLSDPKSVEHGYGPVCAGYHGLPW